MKIKQNKLQSTLKPKASLNKKVKDINSIASNVAALHSPKGNDEIIRTTIHLPKEIHSKIKIECIKNGISFKDFVTNQLIKSMT